MYLAFKTQVVGCKQFCLTILSTDFHKNGYFMEIESILIGPRFRINVVTFGKSIIIIFFCL